MLNIKVYRKRYVYIYLGNTRLAIDFQPCQKFADDNANFQQYTQMNTVP